MKNFCTRVATSHRKLQDQGVTLPEEVQGWFLMRKLHLDASQEAMLLTATAGSYKVGAVVNAVKAILANQRGTHKQKETFSAESEVNYTEASDDEQLVQVLAAELQDKPDYHDEELIEVYETYKQVRSKMNEVKKTRGFRSFGDGSRGQQPWKLTGSISARIEQAKRVSRCHKCGQLGHWKRECKKGQMSSTASSSSTPGHAKEVHIVGQDESWQDMTETDYLRLFHEIDEEVGGEFEGHEAHVADLRSSLDVTLDTGHDEVRQKALSSCDSGARSVDSLKEVGHLDSCTGRSVLFEGLSSENQVEPDQEASEQYDADLERHGVPDTACRRSLIGEQVLNRMEQHVIREGNKVIRRPCTMTFKFGNAGNLTSTEIALVPCSIAGRRIVLQLAVLPGTGSETPLLMSKELLRTLGVVMDMSCDSMHFKNLGVTVPLKVTKKGHYAVPLFSDSSDVFVGEHTHRHNVRTAVGDQIVKKDSQGTRGSSHGPKGAQCRQPCIAESDETWSAGGGLNATDRVDSGSDARCLVGYSTPDRSSWIDGDAGREVQGQGGTGRPDHVRGLCAPEELHPVGSQPYRTRVRSGNASFEAVCGVEGLQQEPKDPARERCTSPIAGTHPTKSSVGVEPCEHAERSSGDSRRQSVFLGRKGGAGAKSSSSGICQSSSPTNPPEQFGAGTKVHEGRRYGDLSEWPCRRRTAGHIRPM